MYQPDITTMLDNSIYNLLNQLVTEHKSLWRIKSQYLTDADGNTELTQFWEHLAQAKERESIKLLELAQKYCREYPQQG